MPGKLPTYDWDERLNHGLGGYRSTETGRVVARREIINALDTAANASRETMRSFSQQLVGGEITLAEWQVGMAQQIKTVHIYEAAAAKGGWAQMSQSDYGFAGYKIKEQYAYLRNFANEIASGKQQLNGSLVARANMYGRAGHGTYEAMLGREASKKGMTEERRVLEPVENCTGCIDQADQGWVPVGTLEPIGSQECRQNCRCHFEYRVGEPQ